MPRGTEEQKRSVPFQLLLLLEKMQDSRQKAVLPLELAYCLQKYNVSCKSPRSSDSCPLIHGVCWGGGPRERVRARAAGQRKDRETPDPFY